MEANDPITERVDTTVNVANPLEKALVPMEFNFFSWFKQPREEAAVCRFFEHLLYLAEACNIFIRYQ